MKIEEEKTITEIKKVIIGYKCDVCGKESIGENFPDDWHHFSSHHEGWGNDSCDSYEWYEVCSPECYIKKIGDCVKILDNELEAEIDEMNIDFARNLYKLFSEPRKAS